MGNTPGRRLNWRQVAELRDNTSFTPDQLHTLKTTFDKLTPDHDRMTKAQFKHGLEEAGIHADNIFIHSMFESFDKAGSGEVDFKEFCCGLSIFVKGDMKDIFKASFELFDLAGNDYITKAEMAKALKSMALTLDMPEFVEDTGGATSPRLNAQAILAFVEEVFAEFDLEQNGRLSFKEFCRAMMKHQLILQCHHQILEKLDQKFLDGM